MSNDSGNQKLLWDELFHHLLKIHPAEGKDGSPQGEAFLDWLKFAPLDNEVEKAIFSAVLLWIDAHVFDFPVRLWYHQGDVTWTRKEAENPLRRLISDAPNRVYVDRVLIWVCKCFKSQLLKHCQKRYNLIDSLPFLAWLVAVKELQSAQHLSRELDQCRKRIKAVERFI